MVIATMTKKLDEIKERLENGNVTDRMFHAQADVRYLIDRVEKLERVLREIVDDPNSEERGWTYSSDKIWELAKRALAESEESK